MINSKKNSFPSRFGKAREIYYRYISNLAFYCDLFTFTVRVEEGNNSRKSKFNLTNPG